MKYLTREIKINENVIIGTTNRTNPKVFYLLFKKWIYTEDSVRYNEILKDNISLLEKNIRQIISRYNFSKKYILDYDLSLKSLKKLKKSNLSINILLKQNTLSSLTEIQKLLQDDLSHLFINFVN